MAKTNYEKKVEEIRNRPQLVLYNDDGGLKEKLEKTSREEVGFHPNIVRQIINKAKNKGG